MAECHGRWVELEEDGIDMGRMWKCPSCFAERPDECPNLQDDPLDADTRERVRDMRAAR